MRNEIVIQISGTKVRHAGFTDIARWGTLPDEVRNNLDRTTILSEKPTYVIRHANDYMTYYLFDRRVVPSDIDTNGILTIVVVIPHNQQLVGGKSPYTLLQEVYAGFRRDYMTALPDGRDKFMTKSLDVEFLKNIIQNYSLEPCERLYVEMQGATTRTLCVPAGQLEEFFRDSQYEDFANYKEIEIGTACSGMLNLSQLHRPRPIPYEVYVNKKATGKRLSFPAEDFHWSPYEKDGLEYPGISFQLGELLQAPSGRLSISDDTYVQINKASHSIDCMIKGKMYNVDCRVQIKGEEPNTIYRAIEDGVLTIFIGSEKLHRFFDRKANEYKIPSNIAGGRVTLSASKYKNLNLEVRRTDTDTRNLIITISATKVASPVVGTFTRKADDSRQRDEERRREEERRVEEERRRQEEARKKKRLRLLMVCIVAAFGLGYIVGASTIGWFTKGDNSKEVIDTTKNKDTISVETLVQDPSPEENEAWDKIQNASTETLDNKKDKMALLTDFISTYPQSSRNTTAQNMKDLLQPEIEQEELQLKEEQAEAEEKARKEAEEKARKDDEKKTMIESRRNEILAAFLKKDLKKCRDLWGNGTDICSKNEQYAIENIIQINPGSRDGIKMSNYIQNKSWNWPLIRDVGMRLQKNNWPEEE